MITKNWPPIGGAPYPIPQEADEGWADLTDFLVALADGAQPQTYQKVASRTAIVSPATLVSGSDCILMVNLTTPGPTTVNLPAGVVGQWFLIVDGKGDAVTNNITVVPNGIQTINGAANFVMSVNNQSLMLAFTGSNNWTIIGSFFTATSGIVPRNSIAPGTPNHVIINDGSGLLSSEATLAKTRGGTGQSNASITFPASGVIPSNADTLAFFASTTSAQLATVISDETGTGSLVFGTSPTIATPTVTGGQTMNNISTPSTPAAGSIKFYSKADVPTYVDSAGNEFVLATTAGALTNPMTTAGDLIYGGALGAATRLAAGSANQVLITGTTPSWGLIANANVDAAAAIAHSKMAALTVSRVLVSDGSGVVSVSAVPSANLPSTASTLAQFAATTSAQLASVISDETGTGALVFANSPTLVTPALGTPSALVLTNATGLPLATGVNTFSSSDLRGRLTDETGTQLAVFSRNPFLELVSINGNGSANAQLRIGASNARNETFSVDETRSTGYLSFIRNNAGTSNDHVAYFESAGSVSGIDLLRGVTGAGNVLQFRANGQIDFPLIHNLGSGNITSGTYTPIIPSGTTNVAGTPTAAIHMYSRVGNVVTMSGRISVACTTAVGTTTIVGIPLPIASNFTSADDVHGSGFRRAATVGTSDDIVFDADTTNDRINATFYCSQTAAASFYYTCQYLIK